MRILYSGHPIWNSFLQHIPDHYNITISKLRIKRGILNAIVTKMTKYHHYNNSIARYFSGVRLDKSADATLVLDIISLPMLSKIAHESSNKDKLFLWLWNPIESFRGDRSKEVIDKIKELGYKIYTFDDNEAQKYKIGWKNQFGIPFSCKIDMPEYDIYYCGKPKGREEKINKFKSTAVQLGLKTNIFLIRDKKQYIPYEDNLTNALNAKCLLEINQGNQKGMSLRSVEALLNDRKLITDNKSIKSADFYNPHNIFILGEDDINGLKQFIDEPIQPIDAEIKERYTFHTWVKSWL